MKKTLRMDELIRQHGTIMDKYDPEKRVGLIVDEWGTWYAVEPGTNPGFLYQQNTLRDALVAGINLNIFNNHCDRVQMANIAQTINVLQAMILTEGEKMILTPTYHVFEMFKGHQEAELLALDFTSPEYEHEGESIPQLSASASRNEEGRILITLCNLHPSNAMQINCELRGSEAGSAQGRVLTASELNARNTFDDPENVKPADFTSAKLEGNKLTAELPTASVVALEVE